MTNDTFKTLSQVVESLTPQLMSYGEADFYCKSIGSKIITIKSLQKLWDVITQDLIAAKVTDTVYRNPDSEFELDFWTSAQDC